MTDSTFPLVFRRIPRSGEMSVQSAHLVAVSKLRFVVGCGYKSSLFTHPTSLRPDCCPLSLLNVQVWPTI